MRRVVSAVSRSMAVLALVVGGVGTAWAGPLNPGDFTPLGPFPAVPGTYTFDTGNLTLTGPGITTPIQGSLSTTGIAVFDFDTINVRSDQTFVGTGALPLALLSQSDITVSGTIDVSGGPGGNGGGTFPTFPPLGGGGGGGGPGGGGGGTGGSSFPGTPLPGGPGGGGGGSTSFGGHGGGGGGGFGGRGNTVSSAAAGVSYGNLALSLQGGSGGGGGAGGFIPGSVIRVAGGGGGGGGGGAVEIGARGGITISGGSILANGGGGGTGETGGAFNEGGGGGGSGGGIFLHGNSVALLSSSVLSATGGDGGWLAGGGGGGQVLIQVEPGGFTGDVGRINVLGGESGVPVIGPPTGEPGVFAITVVPEPASLVLLGIGLLGALGCARYAGRQAAA